MAKKEIIVILELHCGGRVRIVTVGGDPLVSLHIFYTCAQADIAFLSRKGTKFYIHMDHCKLFYNALQIAYFSTWLMC